MNEIWKDIPGYEGLYQVSNIGRVKSLKRTFFSGKNLQIRKTYEENILAPRFYKKGYVYFGLSKDGVVKKLKAHRLVALAFIPNPENKPDIDHINTIPGDNRVSNLRWATKSENQRNVITLGRSSACKMGDKNPMIIKRRPIKQIDMTTGEVIKTWSGVKVASRALGIDSSGICRCANGKLKYSIGYKWEYVTP
jgi:hypothetical protein